MEIQKIVETDLSTYAQAPSPARVQSHTVRLTDEQKAYLRGLNRRQVQALNACLIAVIDHFISKGRCG